MTGLLFFPFLITYSSIIAIFLSDTSGTLSSQRESVMCVPGFHLQRDGEERIEFHLLLQPLLSQNDNRSVQGINDITKIDL